MDGRRFDDLVRDASEPVASRRAMALGLVAGAMGLLRLDDAVAGKRRRRRRHNRRRNAKVCFKGREISVNRTAARELVSRGAQLGACRPLLGGYQSCDNPKLFCNTDPTFCDNDCLCLVTVSGGSICADNGIECPATSSGRVCVDDQDCTNRFGDGFACVPTLGCGNSLPGCTETSNACAQACTP